LCTLLNRTDEALRLMQEVLDRNLWFAEQQLRGDADLASLQGLPDFERMVAVCAARRIEAQKLVKPLLITETPTAPAVPPYPLLLALHGNNGSAASSADEWRPAVGQGWLLALPQSTQIAGADGAYSWNDQDWAVREVCEHYADLRKRGTVDPGRVVIGGFSMGGKIAAWLALSGKIEARGVILVGPYLAKMLEAWAPLIEAAKARALRTYLIIGDQDTGCYEDTLKFADMLRNAHVPGVLRVYPGMDHAFPPDFPQILSNALEFVLRK
jgi:dienelactone hydrolase